MKTQTCKCGNNIQLDYSNAAIVTVNDKEFIYLFRCSQCGQQYYKEIAQPIKLEE